MKGTDYPNLIDRAQSYLISRPDGAGVDELCSYLFGASGAGPWPSLLKSVLNSDQRFEEQSEGRWAFRRGDAPKANSRSETLVALVMRTDGPKPWKHRIVEIAARRVSDGTPAEQWYNPIRPDRPRRLPGYLQEVGLGPETLEQAPMLDTVIDDLTSFLGDAPLVGLDIALAVAFLQFQLRRLGRPQITNPLIELASLAELALGEEARSQKPELWRMARRLDLPIRDDKRLSERARATAEIAAAFLTLTGASGLSRLVDVQSELVRNSQPKSGSPGTALGVTGPRLLLDVDAGRNLPPGPGVYLLKDNEGRTLYVGKARNLRQRVTSYLTSQLERSRQLFGLVETTSRIEVQATDSDLEASLLEIRLIGEAGPRFNVQRQANPSLLYLVRRIGRRGTLLRCVRDPETAALGPLPSVEMRQLVQTARQRYGPDLSRTDAAAEEIWQWLGTEIARCQMPGGLRSPDLRCFAILVPVSPLYTEDIEATATNATRAVVFGECGWIGSITVDPGCSEDALVSELTSILTAEPLQRRPTSSAELAIALRYLRKPSTVCQTATANPQSGLEAGEISPVASVTLARQILRATEILQSEAAIE